MSLAQNLERSLERLLDTVGGRIFSGRLHSSEIATRLSREADLSRFEGLAGPTTANSYGLTINPADVSESSGVLAKALAAEVAAHAARTGLRLEGPVSVKITTSPDVARGQMSTSAAVQPGHLTPWAQLSSSTQKHDLGWNRVRIGRSEDSDVVMPQAEISRDHALIWRESGRSWIKDLGSSNGTAVDGVRLAAQQMALGSGTIVAFAGNSFRFSEL